MYGPRTRMRRNAYAMVMVLMGLSKYFADERPYIVKGNIKLTGSEELPTDRYMDKIIGTWKVINVEVLQPTKR